MAIEGQFKMRKLGLCHNLTACLYQSGIEWSIAHAHGASWDAWSGLNAKYKGLPIPEGDWLGHSSHEVNSTFGLTKETHYAH